MFLPLQISQERRIALVEYIAHLTSEDFDSIPGKCEHSHSSNQKLYVLFPVLSFFVVL